MGIEVINDELYTYLLNYFGKEDKVENIILKNNIDSFFPEVISSKKDSEISILLKKIRYEKYKDALMQIKEEFDKNGIPFLVMKGIVLAMDLYGDKPYMRIFGDIDILVSQKNLSLALSLLVQKGYTGAGNIDVDSYLKDANRAHHIPALINESVSLKNVILEVHVDIVLAWIFQMKEGYTDEILERSYLNKFGIPVMDDYDSIIFMMLHILKHYAYDFIISFIKGEIIAELDLRSLHELATYIYIRKDRLIKHILEERAYAYGMRNELICICGILTEIYPSLRNILDIHLQEKQRASFTNRLSKAVIEMETGDILLGDKQKITAELIARMQNDAFKETYYAIYSGKKGHYSKKVVVDGEYYYGDNRFGTYIDAFEKVQETDCRAEFYLEWDKDFFWLYVTLISSNLFFLDCDLQAKEPVNGKQDVIRINFDTGNRENGKSFARGIVLRPQYVDSNELKIFLNEDIMCNGAATVLDETDYISEARKNGNSCWIKVGIPWNKLGYRVFSGFQFFFDFQVGKYHEDIDEYVVLCWQDAYMPWYDITTYACIELKQ